MTAKGIKEYTHGEIILLIRQYMKKIEKLNNRTDAGLSQIDLEYIEQTLKNNLLKVTEINYTPEEIEQLMQSISNNIQIPESLKERRELLEGRGQYIQGKITFRDIEGETEILRDHEITHAATVEIRRSDTGEKVPQNFDLKGIKTPDDLAMYYPDCNIIGGYYTTHVDSQGKIKDSEDEQDFFDFMEICTESIAGMLNEPDEKTFRTFNVPTDKFSIEYHREMRKLLIMAVGDSKFITDMLREDKQQGLDRLNEIMGQYKQGATIQEYLRMANKYARARTELERIEGIESIKKYCTDIFLVRYREQRYAGIDIDEQVKYYLELLGDSEERRRVESEIRKTDQQREFVNGLKEGTPTLEAQAKNAAEYAERQRDSIEIDNDDMGKDEKWI